MFKKKKNTENEVFTPRDLDSLHKGGWFNHNGLRKDAQQMTKEQKRRRNARWLAIVLILIIIILLIVVFAFLLRTQACAVRLSE